MGYGDHVSHLYVHDARSRGITRLPIDAGKIDYDVVMDHLVGFDGVVAIVAVTDGVALVRDTAPRVRASLEADS